MTERLLRHLSSEWAEAKPIIERAVKYGKYTIGEVQEKVLTMQWVLWKGKDSAILTEQWQDDFGDVLTICYAAGDMDECLAMYDKIEGYARDIGCRKVMILGRKGWDRVMRSRGFRNENMISKELR